jgi:hypothetical protein
MNRWIVVPLTLPRRSTVPSRWLTLTAVSAVGVGTLTLGVGPASATEPTADCSSAGLCAITFHTTGSVASWTVPAGVEEITVVVAGASGGDAGAATGLPAASNAAGLSPIFLPTGGVQQGGEGGQVTATVPVTPNELLDIVVGGHGADGSPASASPAAGGYGGGGAGGIMQVAASQTGGGGGGGSFVVTHGGALLAAAGGGGGAAPAFGSGARTGGTGGSGGAAVASPNTEGLAGGPATLLTPGSAGGPGTQSGPGTEGTPGSPGASAEATSPTALGVGGAGAVNAVGQSAYFTAGGGGGGYRGGGGGGTDDNGGYVGPGGGGAGFLAADANSTATATNEGDGFVTISYQVPDETVVSTPTAGPTTPTAGPTTPTATPTTDTARAKVADTAIVAGSKQTITGDGFLPGETVHGVLHSDPIDLGTAVADANGVVTFSVTLPAGFETGTHAVVLSGATSGRVATVEFTVAATTAAAAQGGLAYTGASVVIPLLTGLTALVVGAVLLLASRRRRTQA